MDRTIHAWTVTIAFLSIALLEGRCDNIPSIRTDQHGDPLPRGAVLRLGTARLQHGGKVNGVACTNDGKTIASSSTDGTARLWNAETGRERHRLDTDNLRFSAIALSPDGKLAATGGLTYKTIRLWDVTTGKETRQFQGEEGGVVHLMFAPDGETLLACHTSNTIRQYNLAKGTMIWAIPGSKMFPPQCAYSPDGKRLAVAAESSKLPIHDSATGAVMHSLDAAFSVIRSAAFSPDGRQIATAAKRDILYWDANTGKRQSRIETNAGTMFLVEIRFSPDGKTVAAVSYDGWVTVWDATSGKLRNSWHDPVNTVSALTYTPDGKFLVCGYDNGLIRFWEAATGKERLARDSHVSNITSVAYSRNGKTITSESEDGRACLWDAATGTLLRRQDKNPKDVLSPSRPTLTAFKVASADGRTVLDVVPPYRIVAREAFSNQERFLFSDHTIGFLDAAFSPDGSRLATGNSSGQLLVWDLMGKDDPAIQAPWDDRNSGDLWIDLGKDDARRAYQAIQKLCLHPDKSVSLLHRQLLVIMSKIERASVRRWIALIDDDDLATREEAVKELKNLGRQIEGFLRQAIEDRPSLYARRRLEQLLDGIDKQPLKEFERQLIRGMEALERIGSPEAQAVLEQLAKGKTETPAMNDARTSLARLRSR